MDIALLKRSILNEIEPYIADEDLNLAKELMQFDEPELAIEFICDKIVEHHTFIPERLGNMLLVISAKLNIEPRQSWWAVVVFDSKTNQPTWLGRDVGALDELESTAREVLKNVQQYLGELATQIDEFLRVGEFGLAMEDLCRILIDDQIPISKLDADKLRIIWLSMGRDPNDLANFKIQGNEINLVGGWGIYMALSYKRHFPSDWSEEKIQDCVLEITTDPKIPWKQITGRDGILCRPHKYLVDGIYDGKQIRIFIEPDKRGILTAYPKPESV